MKKVLLTLLLLCSMQNYAFSHDNVTNGGVVVVGDGGGVIPKIDSLSGTPGRLRSRFFDYMLLGITYSGWQKIPDVPPGRTKVVEDWGNIGFEVFGMRNFPIVRDAVHVGTGLGISVMNFHTNYYGFQFNADGSPGNWMLINDPGFLYQSALQGQAVNRNKMSLVYLEIPLEFKFQALRKSGERRGFLFALGARGGWLMDAKYKMVTDGIKIKTKDFDNLNRFRFGFTARIGYGTVSLYGRLDLTSTFQAPNVPDYKPMTFGIIFSGK